MKYKIDGTNKQRDSKPCTKFQINGKRDESKKPM